MSIRSRSRMKVRRRFPWNACTRPRHYDVVWRLGDWDYEGNVMRVVRREMMEKQGYETVFYDIPIR